IPQHRRRPTGHRRARQLHRKQHGSLRRLRQHGRHSPRRADRGPRRPAQRRCARRAHLRRRRLHLQLARRPSRVGRNRRPRRRLHALSVARGLRRHPSQRLLRRRRRPAVRQPVLRAHLRRRPHRAGLPARDGLPSLLA
ncbi:hypothetical protein LTR16_012090, partial [Cryomyces antarcticus]